MDLTKSYQIARSLSQCLPSKRLHRFLNVINTRLKDTALVFENCGNAGNISAVCRTADAAGIQHVYVIERWSEGFSIDQDAAKGSGKWLTLHRFNEVDAAFESLRREGYAVHATDLGPGAVDMDSAIQRSLASAPTGAPDAMPTPRETPPPFRPRVALAFGNEHRGCSKALLSRCDARFFLPQRGFVQSLNLSVAAALAMHAYAHRTPDYAARSLAGHGSLLAPHYAMHLDTNPAGRAPTQSDPEEARRERIRGRTLSGAADDLLQLLARGDLDGEAAAALVPGGAYTGPRCEGLPSQERLDLLARFLMGDVVQADKILARAGIRPDDY